MTPHCTVSVVCASGTRDTAAGDGDEKRHAHIISQSRDTASCVPACRMFQTCTIVGKVSHILDKKPEEEVVL